MLSICDVVYYADIKTSRNILIGCFLLQPRLNAKYRTCSGITCCISIVNPTPCIMFLIRIVPFISYVLMCM